MKLIKLHTILLFTLLLISGGAYAQGNIRVIGTVENADSHKSIDGAAIFVDDEFECYSDVDGKFSIIVPRDAVIRASHDGYDRNSVIVDGNQQVTIRLKERVVEIQKVTVSYTTIRKKINVERTKLNARKQHLHIKTKYHIPYELFKTDLRFVAQPTIVDKTKDTTYLLRPVVIDGKRYDDIQNRWMNFGESPDPLEEYVVDNDISKDNYIYTYKDSLLIDPEVDARIENDYYSDCFLALASYHEPPIFLDTVRIARGVVNTARHFSYDLEPMLLNGELIADDQEPYIVPTGVDTIYIPAYEMELQQENGEANIAFKVNSPKVDYTDRETRENINHIRDFLTTLQRNPDATIKSISLCGYSSPDGNYDLNKKLAQRRTEELQRIVLSALDESMLEYIDVNVDSAVESWSRVADLARDEYPELATKIDAIVQSSQGDYYTANRLIVRLPEYRSIIAKKYLAPLRKVVYNIDYSIYRPLPYESVKAKYNRGEKLSRYEYYVLISGETDMSLIPAMEQAALKAFPNFVIVANRTAVQRLQADSIDFEILKPSLELSSTPVPVIYNQTIMAIKADSLKMANALSQRLEVAPSTRYLHSVLAVLNSDFAAAYPYFEGSNTLNEAVLLLSMEHNAEAKTIMDDLMTYASNQQRADYCYIYAICGKRADDYSLAITFLEQAILLDNKYDAIASTDADLNDIYEILQQQNKGVNE